LRKARTNKLAPQAQQFCFFLFVQTIFVLLQANIFVNKALDFKIVVPYKVSRCVTSREWLPELLTVGEVQPIHSFEWRERRI